MAAGVSQAKRGDVVTVEGRKVGDVPRRGEIVEVLGGQEHPRYLVRWSDGHESIYYPADDAVIQAPERPKASTTRQGTTRRRTTPRKKS
jgi:hypothetical protein